MVGAAGRVDRPHRIRRRTSPRTRSPTGSPPGLRGDARRAQPGDRPRRRHGVRAGRACRTRSAPGCSSWSCSSRRTSRSRWSGGTSSTTRPAGTSASASTPRSAASTGSGWADRLDELVRHDEGSRRDGPVRAGADVLPCANASAAAPRWTRRSACWSCWTAHGTLRTEKAGEVPLRRGDTFVLPHAAGESTVDGDVIAIRCLPPVPGGDAMSETLFEAVDLDEDATGRSKRCAARRSPCGAGEVVALDRRQRRRQVHAGQVHGRRGAARLAATIRFEGQRVALDSPTDARRARHRDRLPGPRRRAGAGPGREPVPRQGDPPAGHASARSACWTRRRCARRAADEFDRLGRAAAEHRRADRVAVRRAAAERRGRAVGGVGQQGRVHGRADRRTRCGATGTRARRDPAGPRRGHGRRADQPQHARGAVGGRPRRGAAARPAGGPVHRARTPRSRTWSAR